MHTLIKDHKPPGENGIARTRPVVDGNSGMNAPLNNTINTLIEQVARNARDRIAALSTEDCLEKIDSLNLKILETDREKQKIDEGTESESKKQYTIREGREPNSRGRGVQGDTPVPGLPTPGTSLEVGKSTSQPETTRPKVHLQYWKMIMVDADVEALYTSMDPTRTGEAIRTETAESKVKWEGVDWQECLKYIAMTSTAYRIKTMGLEHLVAMRKYKNGPKPGITSENSLSQDREHKEKWVQRGEKERILQRILQCHNRPCWPSSEPTIYLINYTL